MNKVLLAVLVAASPAYAQIYTWTDSGGTTHYTNKVDDVPERYRAKAKVIDLGFKQKFENWTTQQRGQGFTVQSSGQGRADPGGGAQQQEQRGR